MTKRRFTLSQLFYVATIAVALVVAVATTLFVKNSRASILTKADQLRDQAASRIEGKLAGELDRAQRALSDVEGGLRSGAIPVADETLLEAALFTRALADPHLEEITFTQARTLGYDAKGEALLAPEGRWQMSLLRAADGRVSTRITTPGPDGFLVRARDRAVGGSFASPAITRIGPGVDPTTHATFSVVVERAERGRAIWSDLHYSEADQALPEDQQRTVLTVQKAIEDANGNFLGVLRVGLLTRELDALARESIDDDARDPERIAVMAVASGAKGRVHLVARAEPDDQIGEVDGDLRVVPKHEPPELAALEASPLVASLDPKHPSAKGVIDVGGERWLATLRELSTADSGTSGWFVALLVPEKHYTRDFERDARNVLVAFGSTLALVLVISALTLAAVRRGLGKIIRTTNNMRDFDFSPAPCGSPLRDVDDVMQGLERAKTVVRAMEKYIPIDLVHGLYQSNHDPELGGVERELSIMFTDLEGFTTLSEKLPPDELARRLGDYLEAMTTAIEKTGGTIDKYVGDAIMAFWNAPAPTEGHGERACRAALDCFEAARALYASPAWEGLPPMVTRFGIHTARVLVGHFGAPTRLSYTALGDGVNLAARLEPLCKQYGVVSLVSEETVKASGDGFVFRRVDRVAVKGKTRGIDVYELLGKKGDDLEKLSCASCYETAFEAYLARRFERAIELLAPQADGDPPSAVLLDRCRDLLVNRPAEGWDGVHVAHSK